MSFQKYIAPFATLLSNIEPLAVSKDAYPQSYLRHLFENKTYFLSIYADVLDKTIKHSNKEATLLDFGCGNGLFALFAKYAGFKNVIACDVSEPFLKAAMNLSTQLEIPVDKWIVGDEKEVVKIYNHPIDLWIGIDVIEHIYNLDALFKTIQSNNNQMVTLFTTASVYENPFKKRSLQKLMLQDELSDSNAQQSSNFEYAGKSFYKIRKILITKQFPNLTLVEIDHLAAQTRGLIKEDIYKLIEKEFVPNKKISYAPLDSFNTCDPITGSFTERLLPISDYKHLYQHQGLQLDIFNGFYNDTGDNIKSKCLRLANWLIKLLGRKGVVISPFIVLLGYPYSKLIVKKLFII